MESFTCMFLCVHVPVSHCQPFSTLVAGVGRYPPLTQHSFAKSYYVGPRALCCKGRQRGTKYMSCLPLKTQWLKMSDTEGSFLMTILRHLFKVSRAIVLEKNYLRSRQAFPYPQSTLNWGLQFGYLILFLKKI